jgi:hypothetical protein
MPSFVDLLRFVGVSVLVSLPAWAIAVPISVGLVGALSVREPGCLHRLSGFLALLICYASLLLVIESHTSLLHYPPFLEQETALGALLLVGVAISALLSTGARAFWLLVATALLWLGAAGVGFWSLWATEPGNEMVTIVTALLLPNSWLCFGPALIHRLRFRHKATHPPFAYLTTYLLALMLWLALDLLAIGPMVVPKPIGRMR